MNTTVKNKRGCKHSLCTGIAAITLLFAANTAVAQDAATSPFEGYYAGVHAGYGSSSANFTGAPYTAVLGTETVPVSGRNDKFDLDGKLVGIHGGYNAVNENNILFGIEGGLTHLGIKDSVIGLEEGVQQAVLPNDVFDLEHRSEIELDWEASIKGRAGYIYGNTLFFGTAGIALMNVGWKEEAVATGVLLGQFPQSHKKSKTLPGIVLGFGAEHPIFPNVILGADYAYEKFRDFGTTPFGHTNPAQSGKLDDIDLHKATVRLSHKF